MDGRIKRPNGKQKARLAVIGKIKIGIKEGDRGLPRSIDYFHPADDCQYRKEFIKAVGDKPKKITILFPSDTTKDVCFERYEHRDKSGRLIGQSDGETAEVFNSATEKYEARPHDESLEALGEWKTILTLRFLIPAIGSIFGVWQLDTRGADSSIPSIVGTFDAALRMAGPGIVRVPFDLTVEFKKSQKPGATSRFPVLALIPNLSQENMIAVNQMHGQIGNSIKGLLDAPTVEKLSRELEEHRAPEESGNLFGELVETLKKARTPDNIKSIRNRWQERADDLTTDDYNQGSIEIDNREQEIREV